MSENKYKLLLKLKDVVKAYDTGDALFTALDGISLDIFEGEFLGITGKSGAGKTTLLNMISGVSDITSGEVLFFNTRGSGMDKSLTPFSIHSTDEDSRAIWRGTNLGVVYQSFELMPSLNLLENVMLPQDFSGIYHPVTSKERALELLDLVEIVEHAYKIPAHISGGQKQRVAIARALVNDPPLIIADEPTGNLDTKTAETIFQIFEKLVEQGKTVIMVTHDESLEERFSRHLRIVDGRLVEDQPGNHVDLSQDGKQQIERLSNIDIVSTTNPFGDNGNKSSSQNNPTSTLGGLNRHNQETPAIALRNVVKTYSNAAGEFTALKGINLEFMYGEFVSIVGKSGCGKSTLLNMITGIDHPTSGSVLVGGKDIYGLSESQRALWRGQNVGVVFQFFQLLPTLTLLENTMLPMDYCNVYNFNERPDRAMELLAMVGLEEKANMLPASVSSGQQQSAAIARALATDPSLILADEPTGNLDSRSARIILDLFEKLAAQGKTILLVTHDPSITRRTDQTVTLSDGEVIDQTVLNALPYLDHTQMLSATHKTVSKMFPPGSVIIQQGEAVDYFYMVTKGEVEVVVNSKIPETTVARLGSGQFFGEVSLTTGRNSIAAVRTSGQHPTELSMISKEDFLGLLGNAPRMAGALEKVAQIRMDETKGIVENQKSE